MGRGLDKANIATQSYLLTTIFSLIKENQEMTNPSPPNKRFVICDSNTNSMHTSHVSFLQSNVHIITGDLLSDPSRITFMSMHFNVEVSITDQYSPLY